MSCGTAWRGIYVFRSYWARLDHSVAVWTAHVRSPVGYLIALLVVAPVAATWSSIFGPGLEAVEKWIDEVIEKLDRGQPP